MIEVPIARFEETKQHHEQFKTDNEKLNERKVVERAKDILMRQRNLDEDEALKMLRSMAIKKNMRLVDFSIQLIDAAKKLIL